MADVSYSVAFLGGLVSFLAPCVLPLVPGFLSYLAGSSADGKSKASDILVASLLFVAGFSFVFSLLGVLLNTVLTSVAYGVQRWLSRLGGLMVIFFGLYLTGLVRVGWLEREHRFRVAGIRSKYLTSFLFGVAFAAGWTPCVGAALGAILGLAATKPGVAFSLLMAYSLGLGLPFVATGLFASRAVGLIRRYSHLLGYVNAAFGVLLILLGVLIFTQTLGLVGNSDLLNRLLLGAD
jgi:cytochrome c-type biogenesis protein